MFKFQIVIFAFLAGVVAVAVDYSQQARSQGFAPLELGAQGYYETLQTRFNKTKAEKLLQKREIERKALWRQAPRDLLPEAPEGWTRRSFDEGDNVAIIPDEVNVMSAPGIHPAMSYLQKANSAYRTTGTIGRHDREKYIKKVTPRAWVYERGDETVFVELWMIEGTNTNSITGAIEINLRNVSFDEGMNRGFAVIQGVPFLEALNAGGTRSRHYRILRGHLGLNQELILVVHANASTPSTLEILEKIDYVALNNALGVPMSHIAEDIVVPSGEGRDVAENMSKMKAKFDSLLSNDAMYRLGNMDVAAATLNHLVQGYTGVEGVVDLTAGEVPDLTTLIQMGYRKAMRDVMEGGDPEEVYAQIERLMVETADPNAVKEAQEGEMSQALRDELAGTAAQKPVTTQVQPRRKASAAPATSGGRPIPAGKKVVATKPISAKKARAFDSGQPEAVLGMQLAVKRFEERMGAPEKACAYVAEARRVECIVDKNFGVRAAAPKSSKPKASNGKPGSGDVKVNQLGSSKKKKKNGSCGAGQFCSSGN